MWVLHRVIRRLARLSLWSFFADMYVVGQENVPEDGPVLMLTGCSASTVPFKRVIHYWAKSTLFKNPVLGYVLKSTGNIPVDRGNKDNQVLFRGTFEALASNNVVALFQKAQIKDGASWTSLEFAKYVRDNAITNLKPLKLVPAALVYTNKGKYRSSVFVEFGAPIELEQLEAEFLNGEEGATKRAVKKLSQEIEARLVDLSINAPDWETLYSARMALDLLWGSERNVGLPDFVPVSQSLVDIFSTPNVPGLSNLKSKLLTYHSLLRATGLTHADISAIPLPRNLDPKSRDVPLPSRLTTLGLLVSETLACMVRLPFFLLPLITHAPAYYMARFGAKMAEDEEETQAQNKVVFGLLFLLIIYPTLFVLLWALLWLSPLGAVLAGALVYAFAVYHVRVIDDQYGHAKRLLATWRILVGLWVPKQWEISFHALAPYTALVVPKENPFITKKEPRVEATGATASGTNLSTASPRPAAGTKTESPQQSVNPAGTGRAPGKDKDKSDSKSSRKNQRTPKRRLVRHVLRARVEASKALEAFLSGLARDGGRVVASARLAAQFGMLDAAPVDDGAMVHGTRDVREVLAFLKARGANLSVLRAGGDDDDEDRWALSSGDEGTTTHDEGAMSPSSSREDDVVWVPRVVRQEE
ncbi:acyltransferase [Auriculariales sp. MPI-PUGE-AT-0066]|nr:acyltransferase [Auriculariales sp. MPI-PUGE-AT-0066]